MLEAEVEMGSGYAVNKAEGEGEGMCKQPVCTGQKFKSICTKLSLSKHPEFVNFYDSYYQLVF